MANEYIEKKSFIEWVEETYCKPCEAEGRDYNHCRCGSCQYDDMMRDVECFVDADVVPFREGKWEASPMDGFLVCSKCAHYWIYKGDQYDYHFCPNCGAYMGGANDS